MVLMKYDDQNLKLEKIISGLNPSKASQISAFFDELDSHIDLPLVYRNILFDHYFTVYEYYLDKKMNVKKINELLDPEYIKDFYMPRERKFFHLDNAAIIYPIGMRYGQMPMYRISVTLKEDIIPCLLQLAADITIKRFPTLSAIVKRGFFWHYLETTNNIPIVEEEKDIPCKPISIVLRSYRSFRILYYKKRISIEVFHALTDGSGAIVFLKTLLNQYLRLKGVDISYSDEVLDINEEVKDEELVNEFVNAKGDSDFNKFMDKKSVQLDGKISNILPSRILHFEMNSNKLKEVAKKYGGTVTAYILAIEFLAAKKACSDNGLFNIQVPVNMRKFNKSKTLRNYSMYFNVSEELKDLDDIETMIKDINIQLKEKGSEKMMNQMMMTTNTLINSLSFIPLLIKIPLIQSVYTFFSQKIIGSALTNLGLIKLPDNIASYVDKFSVIIVPGRPTRVCTSLATYNDKCVLTIVKANKESIFEEEMYRLFKKDGLTVNVEGSIEYES